MYQEHLLALSRLDRFYVVESPPFRAVELRNPACGDLIRLWIQTGTEDLLVFRCQVNACAVTRASAAALGTRVDGVPLAEASRRVREFLAVFREGNPSLPEWGGEDLRALAEVRAFPLRMRCVLLPWEAFSLWEQTRPDLEKPNKRLPMAED
jgi:nitrogen fixation NifU-like protein